MLIFFHFFFFTMSHYHTTDKTSSKYVRMCKATVTCEIYLDAQISLILKLRQVFKWLKFSTTVLQNWNKNILVHEL